MINRFDPEREVIVVGAGPVGLTAALLLADAGVRTTVVEKATAPGDLPRAISLQDESFRVFDQLGIADALKAESLLDTGSRYFGLGECLLAEARPMPSRLGHPAKTQFDQPILEQLLFDRALAHPGLEVLLGTEAVRLSQDADGVTLEVDSPEGARTLTANWLIGADGGRSFTRSALGIELMGSTQPQRWIVIDLLNEPVQRDPFAEFHCDGERPYVLVPGLNGRLRLEFMLFDHEDGDEMTSPDMIRELLRPFRPSLDPADVRRAAVYVAHQRVARSYRSGRAFLAGDAAHLMPPFAGQGLNAGVRDASNIAWKLIEAVRGGATERLLDTYETERRVHGAKMMTLSRRIGAVVMATHPLATRARDLTVQLLRKAPAVHAYLANMRFVTPPDYSEGLAVRPDARSANLPGVTVGRALGQPRVTPVTGAPAADGSPGSPGTADRAAGLDAILGRGWSVIGLGADPVGLDPYFTAIGATLVRLDSPRGSGAPARPDGAGVVRVREDRETLTAGLPAEPVFVVVRPDHYVAAVFTPGDQDRVVRELRTHLDDRVRAARQPTA
ncbi:FAD-dependent monooxygenase [Micrococcus sp. TA1]|uniref:FAD-dependent monooxygenase n=1 Tax=Micrococcus sp. TA1 TaxID=681627 RepID=UPI00160ED18A|nr:3-(3-hydroxy-phenyl)propionate hydroxylase [Micrococcus sp. TA1]